LRKSFETPNREIDGFEIYQCKSKTENGESSKKGKIYTYSYIRCVLHILTPIPFFLIGANFKEPDEAKTQAATGG